MILVSICTVLRIMQPFCRTPQQFAIKSFIISSTVHSIAPSKQKKHRHEGVYKYLGKLIKLFCILLSFLIQENSIIKRNLISAAVVKSPLQLRCTLARVSSTVNITPESPTVRTADGAYITVLYKAAWKREGGCVAKHGVL